MSKFVVWGCGAWAERNQIVDVDAEPMDCVTEDMPEFDLLPTDFVAEWGQNLGSEHWAEIVTCEEDDLDAATRFNSNVYGYAEVK